MSDEKLCPVVASYLRASKVHWEGQGVSGLYDEVYDELDELETYAEAQLKDPSSQRVRAFFCLHKLFELAEVGEAPLQLTHRGINDLIEFCSEAKDSEEVKLYVADLNGDAVRRPWVLRNAARAMGVIDVVREAAVYLRLRLRNGGTLSGMGKYYVSGLTRARVPSERFISNGRELIGVDITNRGELIP